MSDTLLRVQALTKVFPPRHRGGEPTRAVTNVSFDLQKGETLGLVGESGSGKSTLGQCIVRLHDPDAGNILFRTVDLASLSGRRLRAHRGSVQMIFQDPSSALNPRMTVGDALREALRLRYRHETREQIQRRHDDLFDLIGLRGELADRFPHEMSGGQKQRIGIARALALEPEIVIADEAVSALDVSIQAQIITLLQDLRARLGLTMLFISHDLGVVRYLADRVAVLYLGRLVEIGSTRDVFANPRHPYTEALLSAIPSSSQPLERNVDPYQDIQDKIYPREGCVFAPRCAHVQDACRTAQPPLMDVAPNHRSACIRQDIYPSADQRKAHADA